MPAPAAAAGSPDEPRSIGPFPIGDLARIPTIGIRAASPVYAVRRLVRPLGPHGCERGVQLRQAPRLPGTFPGPVVIGPARRQEPMLQRFALPQRIFLRAMAA